MAAGWSTEDRGKILGFTGLMVGGIGGWLFGSKQSENLGGALAFSGAVGGVLGAHYLNTRVFSGGEIAGLGDLPPSFYEVPGGPRFQTDPAFIRGQLVTLQAWDDQSRAHILHGGAAPEIFFRRYPRWTLYGGPTSAQWIEYTENFLRQWADQNGYRYLPDKPALAVEPQDIKPTWPYNEFRFTQEWEPSPPRTVWLGTQAGHWGWHYA